MKSSTMIAATGAALAFASPLERRKLETTVVMEYVTTTVTAGAEEAKPTIFGVNMHRPQVTYPVVQPAPEPATTEKKAPVVIVTVTPEAPAPSPEPTTSTPPPVVYVTESQPPAPEPTSEKPVEVPAPEPTSEKPVEAPAPTTVAAPAAPSEPAGDDIASAAVYHHNIHRSNHSSPEMDWSDKFAGYARNHAATCKYAHDMNQGDKGYGQNIAMWALSSGAEALGEAGAIKMATTDMWYNGEFKAYKPEFYGQDTPDMSDFKTWGHISQLLWKDSNQLGCAAQFCAKGTMYDDMDAWFMVCNYGPPGNVGGYYGKNVFKPLGKSIVTA